MMNGDGGHADAPGDGGDAMPPVAAVDEEAIATESPPTIPQATSLSNEPDVASESEPVAESAEIEEEEEDPNAVDESTALLMRVAELEAQSLARRDHRRHEVSQSKAHDSLLNDVKHVYSAAIDRLKTAEAEAQRTKPTARSSLDAVEAQMRQTPELSALLLRLSSFVYRTEHVQAQIAVSKEWNQELMQHKQLAQHSQLRDIDQWLAQPVENVLGTADRMAMADETQPASLAVADVVREAGALIHSARGAVLSVRDEVTRAQLGALLDAWESLVGATDTRATALAGVSSALTKVDRLLDAAHVANPHWDLLEAQEVLHRSTNQASSSVSATEAGLLRKHDELRQTRASLELGLATAAAEAAVAAEANGLANTDNTQPPSDGAAISTHVEAQIQKRLRLLHASVTDKQARRDMVAEELSLLRRAVRCEVGSDAVDSGVGQCGSSHFAVTEAVLGRALLTRVTEQLETELLRWHETSFRAMGVVREGHGVEALLRCDEALEGLASAQQTLNTLLADNVLLWQQLQDAHLATAVAVEPEKAANLAKAVLWQCGALWGSKQEEEEGSAPSLRLLESQLLKSFEASVAFTAQLTQDALAEVEGVCLSSWRQLLHDTDTLVQLMHLRAGGSASTGVSTAETSARVSLRKLRDRLHTAACRPAVSSKIPCTTNTVPLSAVSQTAIHGARERVAKASEQALTKVQDVLGQTAADSAAVTESLQWYSQHPLDRVEEELAAERERSERLHQLAKDAKATLNQKQQATRDVAALSEQLEAVRTERSSALRDSLAALEERVSQLEARAPLWQLLREEQQQRHNAVVAEESAEFDHIADVFTRTVAALLAANEPPHTTAEAPAQPLKWEEPLAVKEEALEDDATAGVERASEPREASSEALPAVKEELSNASADGAGAVEHAESPFDPRGAEEEVNGEHEAMEASPRSASVHSAEQEEPQLAADESGLTEGVAPESLEPLCADDVSLPHQDEEQPEDTPTAADHVPDDPTAVLHKDATVDASEAHVKPEAGDDPFFSGFGFGDD